MFKKKLFLLFCLPFILGLFMLNGCGILPVTPVAVGDSYGGGIVAYILVNGDTGYDPNVQHGLIAAAADQNGGATIAWSNIIALVGTTGTAIGTGQANTTAIVGQSGCDSGAAYLCYYLEVGIYKDWFLPSKDELNQLHANLANTTEKRIANGFASAAYWSSSESGDSSAWYQNFSSGYQGSLNKNYAEHVRAVRTF